MARRKLPKVLTRDELRDLLRQPNVQTPTGLRNKAMLKVMAYGGLRLSEVIGLRTKDLRREDGRLLLEVRGGKGGRDRTVPLPDHVAETLETWLVRRREIGVRNGPVFCTISKGRNVHPVATEEGFGDDVTETKLEPGRALNPSYVRAMVGRLAERAGIEKTVSPHVLRHTAATETLRHCKDLRRVQELLGHKSPKTTEVYTEVLAEDVAEAVDAVPDVEANREPETETSEAEQVAASVLAALPQEVREALARMAGERADSASED
ncbi:MAG: tyrosine-type recombinase/integrase [Armatimonadota bacterium]|nr:tyrosine-type recombinase/integrase [Armatimonadota bacterium]